jgi:hypothetical protein
MLAVIVAGLVASALSMHEAQAAQINGTIGFAGSVRFDSSVFQTVHQVNVWHDVNGNLGFSNVAAFTGDFMGHVVLGQQATMHTPWIFIPSTDTPVLWAVGGFSFHLRSSVVVHQDEEFLQIKGTGIISGNGFDDTVATWAVTIQDAGGNPDFFTFSASSAPLTPGSFAAVILATEPANLKGYWKCDETSGTTLADSSGNSKNLTITGAINTNYWLGESGEQGTGFRTDGVAGYASRNDAVIPSLDNTNFTLFALFKGGTDFNAGGALALVSTLNEKTMTLMGNYKQGILSQAAAKARGNSLAPISNPIHGGTAFDGTWHSLTWRRNGTAFDLFVDGSVVASTTASLTIGGAMNRTCLMHPLTPGTPPATYAKGSVQHAAIWNRALSNSEIMTIQAARNISPTSTLTP